MVVDGEVQTWKVEVDDDLQAASPTQGEYVTGFAKRMHLPYTSSFDELYLMTKST